MALLVGHTAKAAGVLAISLRHPSVVFSVKGVHFNDGTVRFQTESLTMLDTSPVAMHTISSRLRLAPLLALMIARHVGDFVHEIRSPLTRFWIAVALSRELAKSTRLL